MFRIFAGLITLAWLALALTFAFGVNDSPASDRVAKADLACLECHDYYDESLAGSSHSILRDGGAEVSCLSCHPGADAGHAEDPDNVPAGNPESLTAALSAAKCATCHVDPHARNAFERDPHADANVNCSSCHRIHNSDHAGLLRSPEPTLCLDCHASVRSDFAQLSRHPVADGVMNCSDCHTDLAQSAKHGVYSGPGETCVECHGEFRGPFPYQHLAAVAYSSEQGGCLNCHVAHGSSQPRMLKQSYESPGFGLCSNCHVQPGHRFNAQHGDAWANQPCNTCHVDVHGSYTSANFLDPALAAEGCFAAGCHQP